MAISDVKLFKVNHKTIKANGTIVLDGKYKVKVKIVQGQKGLFTAFPSEKYTDKEGKDAWSNLFEPITKEAFAEINTEVLKVFTEQSGYQPPSQEPSSQMSSGDIVPF
jgi:DNA-binding cell septation regulator SpoVG